MWCNHHSTHELTQPALPHEWDAIALYLEPYILDMTEYHRMALQPIAAAHKCVHLPCMQDSLAHLLILAKRAVGDCRAQGCAVYKLAVAIVSQSLSQLRPGQLLLRRTSLGNHRANLQLLRTR